MRVLWITNIPFGKLLTLARRSGGETSGSWLDATLNAFIGDSEHEIIVATIGDTDKVETLCDENITYCLLPGGSAAQYNAALPANKHAWEEIQSIYRPELIHVWGTEFSHGYLALQVMKGIPSVIYMQGVMRQIARYYISGMSPKDLRSSITLRDIIKRDWIKQAQRKYFRRSMIEAEMINKSGNVIVENDWCAAQCKVIAPDCIVYKCKLNIKSTFFKHTWDIGKIEPYSIMNNGAEYPIKGLHILLKALELVVKEYPQTKLYVPGVGSPFERTGLKTLKVDGYSNFIKKIIKNLGLDNHVYFLGRISSEKMAGRMAKSNVFVMSSSIENHSSSLIEAMIVGIPCISSYVGGVPEYVEHNKTGLLYRFEEYEVLASYILKIFGDPKCATDMSMNASYIMRKSRSLIYSKNQLIAIYQRILSTH